MSEGDYGKDMPANRSDASGGANPAAVLCPVCFHHCRLSEGAYGICGARRNIGGEIRCINYGRLTSLALDPIEKKPLAYFYPGSMVLSLGSFGCNLACPFCQNHEIAAGREKDFGDAPVVTPRRICEIALEERKDRNIGVAYTYNEALVGYEFVRDTARLVHEAGMFNVLVSNGTAEIPILEEILPYMDAMNIDLKGFRPEVYRRLGGDLEMVKAFITRAVQDCHVELTTLIVPGLNDAPEDMEAESAWIAGLDPGIPLHITRYFPRYQMREPATSIAVMEKLQAVASRHLQRVRLGNA